LRDGPDPCCTSSRRGDRSTYRHRELLITRLTDLGIDLSWPLAYTHYHHAGLVMGTRRRMYQPKLCQTSSSALRHGRTGAIEVVPGFTLHATTRSAKGDGPKTPEHLGCRPAGTSLLSLGRASTCRSAEARHHQEQGCAARVKSSVLGNSSAPLQGSNLFE
jgi:hypothetical protein